MGIKRVTRLSMGPGFFVFFDRWEPIHGGPRDLALPDLEAIRRREEEDILTIIMAFVEIDSCH